MPLPAPNTSGSVPPPRCLPLPLPGARCGLWGGGRGGAGCPPPAQAVLPRDGQAVRARRAAAWHARGLRPFAGVSAESPEAQADGLLAPSSPGPWNQSRALPALLSSILGALGRAGLWHRAAAWGDWCWEGRQWQSPGTMLGADSAPGSDFRAVSPPESSTPGVCSFFCCFSRVAPGMSDFVSPCLRGFCPFLTSTATACPSPWQLPGCAGCMAGASPAWRAGGAAEGGDGTPSTQWAVT